MITLFNTAAAKNSDPFTFKGIDGRPASIFVEGLAGTEVVTLQFSTDRTTWNDVYCNGLPIQLTITNNVLYMNVRGTYRLSKILTSEVVKATLITENEEV